MLLKPYKTSDYKIALESLLKRLNPGHEKAFKIEEELSLQEAGENGEKHLLTILTENQLPKNTYILHNISIKSIITIQIDIILISPSWCLILEVKNLNGELTFTNNPPQLICVKEDKKLSYRSPEAQIDQYILGLTTFLEQHQIKVPIYGAIVLPYNNAIIDKPPSKYPLFMGRGIIQYIWSLPKKEVIPSKQVGEFNSIFKRTNLGPFPPNPVLQHQPTRNPNWSRMSELWHHSDETTQTYMAL
ncbi:nuclease-related domain-containing protein [Ureibacillus sp. FSL K6-0786]|uniref:nuclease-related domain-containing protein n=1 Tax=Ureibacillus sp. FSL K6-0786 TaxID=2954607 RepID=UPI0030D9EA27